MFWRRRTYIDDLVELLDDHERWLTGNSVARHESGLTISLGITGDPSAVVIIRPVWAHVRPGRDADRLRDAVLGMVARKALVFSVGLAEVDAAIARVNGGRKTSVHAEASEL